MEEMITIPKQEYLKLIECRKVDQELIEDIARGINDILQGKIEEI